MTAAAAILIIRVQLSSMQTLEHSQRAEHCPRTLRCKCRLRTTLALSRGQQRPTQQQLVTYLIVVLAFVLVMIAYVSLLDVAFGKAVFAVFGGK